MLTKEEIGIRLKEYQQARSDLVKDIEMVHSVMCVKSMLASYQEAWKRLKLRLERQKLRLEQQNGIK